MRAERAAALGQRRKHLAKRQHADQPAVVHDDQRTDVVAPP